MNFELKPLPYAVDAFEPYLGAETLRLHREKHHAGYLEELEPLVGASQQAADSLATIVASATGHLFETAAQVWRMFRMEAAEHFGSGWVWLVVDRGRLRVTTTDNAELPLTHGQTPLVTLDLSVALAPHASELPST